jgi:urease accessory protein
MRIRDGNPVKLFAPNRPGHAAWIYTSTYGGGLVSGDAVSMAMTLHSRTQAVVTTQSATKIYGQGRAGGTSYNLQATVDDGALLVLAAEPVIPFANAHYTQHQNVELHGSAGLVLIDGLAAGRISRGERWAFDRFDSCVDVSLDDYWLCRETLCMTPPTNATNGNLDPGRCNCFVNVLLVGPRIASLADSIVQHLNELALPTGHDLIAAASPLPRGPGAMLRLAGVHPQKVQGYAYQMLDSLKNQLGVSLDERKW